MPNLKLREVVPGLRFAAALATVLLGLSLSESQASDGLGLYLKHCAPCHGKTGDGNTPAGRRLSVPELSKSQLPPEKVIKNISEGQQDSRGRQRMPAFKPALSDAEVDAVADFVLKLRK
jgi:mono/diheme cytochrome c family protein